MTPSKAKVLLQFWDGSRILSCSLDACCINMVSPNFFTDKIYLDDTSKFSEGSYINIAVKYFVNLTRSETVTSIRSLCSEGLWYHKRLILRSLFLDIFSHISIWVFHSFFPTPSHRIQTSYWSIVVVFESLFQRWSSSFSSVLVVSLRQQKRKYIWQGQNSCMSLNETATFLSPSFVRGIF